jgi:hypothetical protein
MMEFMSSTAVSRGKWCLPDVKFCPPFSCSIFAPLNVHHTVFIVVGSCIVTVSCLDGCLLQITLQKLELTCNVISEQNAATKGIFGKKERELLSSIIP